MFNIASVKEKIQNIEYGWNKPASYLVLVPVISMIVQNIQRSYFKERSANSRDGQEFLEFNNRVAQMHNWHWTGAVIQLHAAFILFPVVPSIGTLGVLALTLVYNPILVWTILDDRFSSATFYDSGRVESVSF